MMKEHKIVIDTNVLISTFVFKGFAAKIFEYCAVYENIILSNWILNELTEKLLNKFKIEPTDVDDIIQLIKDRATILEPINKLPNVCRDKDDNNILQLSEYAKANYIITGDKDLLILNSFNETIILNPRTFHKKYCQNLF